jgi:hypothetical protein
MLNTPLHSVIAYANRKMLKPTFTVAKQKDKKTRLAAAGILIRRKK